MWIIVIGKIHKSGLEIENMQEIEGKKRDKRLK